MAAKSVDCGVFKSPIQVHAVLMISITLLFPLKLKRRHLAGVFCMWSTYLQDTPILFTIDCFFHISFSRFISLSVFRVSHFRAYMRYQREHVN